MLNHPWPYKIRNLSADNSMLSRYLHDTHTLWLLLCFFLLLWIPKLILVLCINLATADPSVFYTFKCPFYITPSLARTLKHFFFASTLIARQCRRRNKLSFLMYPLDFPGPIKINFEIAHLWSVPLSFSLLTNNHVIFSVLHTQLLSAKIHNCLRRWYTHKHTLWIMKWNLPAHALIWWARLLIPIANKT